MRCSNCAAPLAPRDTRCSECGADRPQLLPPFADVERQYAALCARREAGQTDEASFQAELQKLTALDDGGSYWMIGADGEWYRYEEREWVRREPPIVERPVEPRHLRPISQPIVTPAPPQAPVEATEPEPGPPPVARAGLPWRWVAGGCGGTLVMAVVVVGALWLAGMLPPLSASATSPEPTVMARQAAAAPTATTAVSLLPTATPEPTVAVEDTPTIAATQAPVDAYFSDDFSNPSSGWENGDYDSGNVGHGDGYYYVISTSSEKAMWGRAFRNLADVTIDLQANAISGPADGDYTYGLGCRVQPSGDGYYFLISADGLTGIFRATGKQYRPLIDWTQSSAVWTGRSGNHMRAMCDGPALALVVNGILVAATSDQTYVEGDIALQAWTGGEEPAEIHFENLLTEAPLRMYLPMVRHSS